jgi:hypothetical protein
VTLLITVLAAAWAAQAAPSVAPRPDVLEQIACAPAALPAPAPATLRVLGGNVHGRIMFGPGDAVIIGAGSAQGIRKGQQFFVRRAINDASVKPPKVGALYGVHTAGWITVVDVKDTLAVATVTHACDGVLEGDYLEPYVAPVVPPAASVSGTPDYDHPGHIILADERRQTGYPGLVMLIDRGSDDGVRPGQTASIYRETVGGQGPIIDVGRATVISATAKSSLVRVGATREAVYMGDLVALHR